MLAACHFSRSPSTVQVPQLQAMPGALLLLLPPSLSLLGETRMPAEFLYGLVRVDDMPGTRIRCPILVSCECI